MPGQDNLHIAREIFAAWNAHDVEGFEPPRVSRRARYVRTAMPTGAA